MPIERETIVTTGPSGASIVMGVVAVALIVVLALWFFGAVSFGPTPTGSTVDIDVPAITITPDAQ